MSAAAKSAAVLLVLFAITLVWRMPSSNEGAQAEFSVGLVFDVGGLGDKSFNDSAYLGLLRAKKELQIGTTTIEPGDGSDRAAALRMLAASGAGMVIGVGFIFTDDVLQVAGDYPKVAFVCLDMAVRDGQALPANVLGLKFKEEQGSFLAGVFAALVSQTKHVGFVGGMDIPLIHKFSAGYRAGVMAQCADCRVDVLFAGATPHAFKDPGKGREMALSQYQSGADIIFHAAGSTGLGVFQAAREQKRLAIGVDADQTSEAPEVVATSMVKRIDTAVFDAIARAKSGAFKGGVVSLGLKEDGLELARNATNAKFFTEERVAVLDAYRRKIVDGAIEVPSHD